MRSVTVSVVRALPGHEALVVDDARGNAVRGSQIVIRVDSAVDHRNSHTCSIQAGLPCNAGAYRRGREVKESRGGPVERDVANERISFQRRKHTGGYFDTEGFDRIEGLVGVLPLLLSLLPLLAPLYLEILQQVCQRLRSVLGGNAVELYDHVHPGGGGRA